MKSLFLFFFTLFTVYSHAWPLICGNYTTDDYEVFAYGTQSWWPENLYVIYVEDNEFATRGTYADFLDVFDAFNLTTKTIDNNSIFPNSPWYRKDIDESWEPYAVNGDYTFLKICPSGLCGGDRDLYSTLTLTANGTDYNIAASGPNVINYKQSIHDFSQVLIVIRGDDYSDPENVVFESCTHHYDFCPLCP